MNKYRQFEVTEEMYPVSGDLSWTFLCHASTSTDRSQANVKPTDSTSNAQTSRRDDDEGEEMRVCSHDLKP